jgi:hypothetical protein
MADATKYPHLDNLIGGYLNQDYRYYADTLEGVIDAYIAEEGAEQVLRVRGDIARFLRDHQGPTLEQEFEASFCADFDPRLFGLTGEGFLKKLDRQLQGSPEP